LGERGAQRSGGGSEAAAGGTTAGRQREGGDRERGTEREGQRKQRERERSGNAEAMLKSEHYREGKGTAKDNKRRAHGGRREQQRRDDAEARRGAVARHEWRRGAKHVGGDETEPTDDTRQMGGTCAAGEPRREELGDGIGVEKRRGGGGG
jgi:hypothetical protein